MAALNGDIVPGYEQEKLQWEDKADMVTISMPMSKECLRSLAVHTDGFTVQLSWGSGSVVIDLYAQILESQTGPGQVTRGIFTLPMKKVSPVPWPRLLKKDPSGAVEDESDPAADGGGCFACGIGESACFSSEG